LRADSRINRIYALLVTLLYVFFTTFGAVAHTHTAVSLGRTAPGPSRLANTPAADDSSCLVSSQRECAACEWQALSVTQTASPQVISESALLPIVPVVPSFSIFTVCLARFSSRGPPA